MNENRMFSNKKQLNYEQIIVTLLAYKHVLF